MTLSTQDALPSSSARAVEAGSPVAFSIVAPCFNEDACVEALVAKIGEIAPLHAEGGAFELVLVDDGSTDGTWSYIQAAAEANDWVRGIRFSRNFGQHKAIRAGLAAARGGFVFVIDADLQDPIERMGDLIAAHRDGHHIVICQRVVRGDPLIKRFMSWVFWAAVNLVSERPVPSNQTMLRLLSRRAVDALLSMGDRTPFLAGQTAWIGFEPKLIPVDTHDRFAGKSKYRLGRALRFTWDAITSFSTVPLKLIGLLGWFLATLAFVLGATLAVLQLFGVMGFDPGWPSLVLVQVFFGGLTLAMLGIVGNYLGRVFNQVMDRPEWVVQEATWEPTVPPCPVVTRADRPPAERGA